MKKIGRKMSLCFSLFTCLILVFFDQLTKYIAYDRLRHKQSVSILKNWFVLEYVENRGAAFGILQNRQIVFIVGAVAVICVALYMYTRIPSVKKMIPLRVCAVLIISGAVGNLYDRIIRRFVVDFFYFKLIDFPVFNVADCYVVVGCFLFAFLILFVYKEDELKFFSKREK